MEWISVKDRMPKEREESQDIFDSDILEIVDCKHYMASELVIVAVLDDDGKRFVADDITVDGKWYNFPSPAYEVTHWMQLPPAPIYSEWIVNDYTPDIDKAEPSKFVQKRDIRYECPECGRESTEKTKFCPHCGKINIVE